MDSKEHKLLDWLKHYTEASRNEVKRFADALAKDAFNVHLLDQVFRPAAEVEVFGAAAKLLEQTPDVQDLKKIVTLQLIDAQFYPGKEVEAAYRREVGQVQARLIRLIDQLD